MPKPRSKTAVTKKADPDQAAKLADSLADKPYGSVPVPQAEDKLTRLTISLPFSLFDELEDASRKKRRRGESDWCMSALVRDALRDYLKH